MSRSEETLQENEGGAATKSPLEDPLGEREAASTTSAVRPTAVAAGTGAFGPRGGAGAAGTSALRAAGTADGAGGQGVATAIAEVSERATLLIHEEIELAKAEVAEKVNTLAKGAVVAVAAGTFIVTALFFVLIGGAWLLYYYLPIGNAFTYFWGFFAMAVILLVFGVAAGLTAARVVRRGSPPTPDR